MDTQPSLDQHRQGAFAADIAVYDAIVARLRTTVATFPAALQPQIKRSLDVLVPGEFSQIAALLPFWLQDVLPVSEAVCTDLGMAHLWGWWYYWAQDEILDGSQSTEVLLPGHLALLQMLDQYTALGLRATPAWPLFDDYARCSAAAYAVELEARCQSLVELTPERLAPLTIDLIIDRAAAFFFNSLAQAQLAGFPPDDPRSQAIQTVLRCFTAMRQICDDASDWIDDLKSGHVNPVAAQMILMLYRDQIITTSEELSLERLGLYHVRAEHFWLDIERMVSAYATTALAALAPFGSTRLQGLIMHQLGVNNAFWESARTQRSQLRALFGL